MCGGVRRLSLVNGGLTIKRGSVCIKHTLLSINRTLSVCLCSPRRMRQLTTGSNVIGQSPSASSWQLNRSVFTSGSDLTQSSWRIFFFQLPASSWFHSCCTIRGQTQNCLSPWIFLLSKIIFLITKQKRWFNTEEETASFERLKHKINDKMVKICQRQNN